MKPFLSVTSIAIPLIRINVDTDAIIPSREMKRVSKKGLSEGLFAGWRYKTSDSRDLIDSFVLNNPRYKNASVLLSGANFGCGSSREHAVWALHEYGINVIIAPSFGAIFYKNCIRNGILPIVSTDENIETFIDQEITIDLTSQLISSKEGKVSFGIAPSDKDMLLKGLDDIDLNLLHKDKISQYECKDKINRPWAYL